MEKNGNYFKVISKEEHKIKLKIGTTVD